ncbi:MAG TPA: hypothetical protein PLY94_09260, partial [Gemmatimonadaceae bacterium]|nr:hypothetical protein [Gemmatimonadaceae bacterium]
MPRQLKLALQIVVAVALSASISVIAISIVFSRGLLENLMYATPPLQVATTDTVQALMQPVMPAVDPTYDAADAAVGVSDRDQFLNI